MVVRAKKGTFKQMGNCTNYHTDVKKKAKKCSLDLVGKRVISVVYWQQKAGRDVDDSGKELEVK